MGGEVAAESAAPRGVKTIGASGLVGAGADDGAGVGPSMVARGSNRSGVGSPTGTVMTVAVPLTVTDIVVFALLGREQYPISTQLSPPAP